MENDSTVKNTGDSKRERRKKIRDNNCPRPMAIGSKRSRKEFEKIELARGRRFHAVVLLYARHGISEA